MDDRLVGRAVQYHGHAEAYARHAAASPYNAGIDRPAVLALLGDVNGLRILDVGCGPGLYAQVLTTRGADVTGFDQSHDMITLARQRVPTARFRVHDLADPLTWIPDQTFDRALLALTLHYVDNPVAALRELHRVLIPGGLLVVSLHHPVTDWLKHGGSYFATAVVEEAWSAGWSVRYRRQPLEQTLAEFSAAGFALDRLVEPRPVAELATGHPDHDQGIGNRPTFIAFRLRTQP
jgi:ubiquinone/menaquinone biosynthesis C-methylase UbiE